jgi:pimeloyl-ACP methyl ester carboxylesterase
MRRIVRAAREDAVADTRLVWLPGAFDSPENFLEAGFATEIRRRRMAVDLEFVELELAHLGDRSLIGALAREVTEPARAAGVRCIWLCGISLGAWFALDYAAVDAGPWDGLCLIAPYLGNRPLVGEIAAAGSLAAWEGGPLAESDEERRIWRYLQAGRAGSRPVYLGYGREDRFAAGHALLAAALPARSVDVIDGGHDWPTWSMLLRRFLDSELLCR